tara:strand:+ start:552 stop:953 length:402 start_codon:yes stop_codon:yes gene_type:complete
MPTQTKPFTDEEVAAFLTVLEMSTDFRLGLMPNEAIQLVAKTGDYNEYNPDYAVGLIESIGEIFDELGVGCVKFSIGREGSMCLYAQVFSLPDEIDKEKLALKLESAARDACADEHDVSRDDGWRWEYRVWWD